MEHLTSNPENTNVSYMDQVGYLPMWLNELLPEGSQKLNAEPVYDVTVDAYCDVYKLESGSLVQVFQKEYES